MRTNIFLFAGFVAFFAFMRGGLCAQKAPTAFSTYGQIKPVQKYSSNPFWTKDSPYNQRIPTPIYATGADLNTGDCNRVVSNLLLSYCTSIDCSDKRISDVRPVIMVQLSQLPGHNFATSCGGYIDAIFENYKKSYGNTSAVNVVKTTQRQNDIQLDNLFAKPVSEYESGVAARTAELNKLQAKTTKKPAVTKTEFPKTISDIGFTDRVANSTAGYAPYKDKKSYLVPDFEDEDETFFERLKLINPTEFCRRRPQDDFCNPDKKRKKKNDSDDEEEENGTPECVKGSSADCPIVLTLD
ncbi:MAG: hypothetical protein J5742_04095 [Alphaproteobacteria bacterium]|nr:hypothetical protein [Alphaproteobacteria bacterium]